MRMSHHYTRGLRSCLAKAAGVIPAGVTIGNPSSYGASTRVSSVRGAVGLRVQGLLQGGPLGLWRNGRPLKVAAGHPRGWRHRIRVGVGVQVQPCGTQGT